MVAAILVGAADWPRAMLSSPVAQVADAVIEVLAQDESQAVLPGVTVTVLRPDTGYTQTNVTDATGRVRFIALQPGTYNVKVGALRLHDGQPGRRHAPRRPDGEADDDAQGRQGGRDGERHGRGAARRRLQDGLVDQHRARADRVAAGRRTATSSRWRSSRPACSASAAATASSATSPVIGAAGNASQSTIMVDGVDFTDPTLGLARARFSQEAISEFRVIANRFDTEIGGSAGGALSIVTKSGTNDLHGSRSASSATSALRAKGELDLKKNDYSRQQFGGTIGGPIVKDRDALLRVVRAGQREQLRAVPAGRRLRVARRRTSRCRSTSRCSTAGSTRGSTTSRTCGSSSSTSGTARTTSAWARVVDETAGMQLNRDNYNFTATHCVDASATARSTSCRSRSAGASSTSRTTARRWPSTSRAAPRSRPAPTSSATRTTPATIFEVRDTFFMRVGSGKWAQDMKFGGAWQMVSDDWTFPVYPKGLLIYVTDTPGAAAALRRRDRHRASRRSRRTSISGFIQDDLRPSPRVTINLGLRYDLDTNGNNPDYTRPARCRPRAGGT